MPPNGLRQVFSPSGPKFENGQIWRCRRTGAPVRVGGRARSGPGEFDFWISYAPVCGGPPSRMDAWSFQARYSTYWGPGGAPLNYPGPGELGIDPAKRVNLARLAVGVRDYRARLDAVDFEMDYWGYMDGGRQLDIPSMMPECGTAACLAGHGPLVGLDPERRESWDDYVDRMFLSAMPRVVTATCSTLELEAVADPTLEGAAHDFLFSAHHENDAGQALARVAYFLQKGKVDPDYTAWAASGDPHFNLNSKYRVDMGKFAIDWPFIEAVARGED